MIIFLFLLDSVLNNFREKYLGKNYINKFCILFVGKWETRKGIKLLLQVSEALCFTIYVDIIFTSIQIIIISIIHKFIS